jgi:lipopolysaccharide transport system ATP-binding protein
MFYGARDIITEISGHDRVPNLRKGEFWALKNVNLCVEKGETLGMVGPNGSGKTTLLRLIAGLMKPDTGIIKVRGRIASMIQLGVGFSPILTARENIYSNLTLYGLSKKEIDARFDEIVDFAEIAHAIDAPLRTFSAGMHARLGFACAVHSDADILLIDEVLSVGDIKFRSKCRDKITELNRKQVSSIFVSHHTESVFAACETGAFLSSGKLLYRGPIANVIGRYEKELFETKKKKLLSPAFVKINKENNGPASIKSLCLKNSEGQITNNLENGKPAKFIINLEVSKKIDDANITIYCRDNYGKANDLFIFDSEKDNARLNFHPGSHSIEISMPNVNLAKNSYSFSIEIKERNTVLDNYGPYVFNVKGAYGSKGSSLYQPRTWRIIK